MDVTRQCFKLSPGRRERPSRLFSCAAPRNVTCKNRILWQYHALFLGSSHFHAAKATSPEPNQMLANHMDGVHTHQNMTAITMPNLATTQPSRAPLPLDCLLVVAVVRAVHTGHVHAFVLGRADKGVVRHRRRGRVCEEHLLEHLYEGEKLRGSKGLDSHGKSLDGTPTEKIFRSNTDQESLF